MGIDHYENFPVASILLPRHLRRPILLIYRFARTADDYADEGTDTPAQRLDNLAQLQRELDHIETGRTPRTPLFVALREVMVQHALPVALFRDLLSAFSQDVVRHRYRDFSELLDYCRRSANPVGRLLLYLFEASNQTNIAYSDNICTSLQLINFLQDVESDYRRGRIYFPLDEMQRFAISEQQIAAADTSGNWEAFMRFQIDRASDLLRAGAPLGRRLPGRIGLELRTIVCGGARIIEKLRSVDGDVFRRRPLLRRRDWAVMLYRSLFAYP